jgi:Mn-dependent DtxR family transcriptional regulator
MNPRVDEVCDQCATKVYETSRALAGLGGFCLIEGTKAMPSTPSQSAEDYLERIHELIEEKGYARVVDIASSLRVRQASVTGMVQKLGELGYLNYEKYRGLILTEKGRKVACTIQKRHETLSRFFSLLQIDSEIQQRDIEGIEHHLSTETVNTLSDLAAFLERNPETLRSFLASRRGRGSSPDR